MQPFVGEISIFCGNFAPHGWAMCDGQLLSIQQHIALFSLLGTNYGGDGQATFGLPDLRGRIPAHPGSQFALGQTTGVESVTLLSSEMPSHTHPVVASGAAPSPTGSGVDLAAQPLKVPASPSKPRLYAPIGELVAMSPTAVLNEGGGQPHSNMAPFLAVNFIIALEGIFPQRP